MTRDQNLRLLVIRRLHLVPSPRDDAAVTSKKKITFLAEMAGLGYKISNASKYNDSILDHYDEMVDVLKDMRGGNVEYVPLFQGFPNDVPNEDEYFAKRILGFMGNFIGLMDEGRSLDNGIKVPSWLFDLSEFGADPITQFQDRDLFESGVRKQRERRGDDIAQWVSLEIAGREEMTERARNYLFRNLYAKSSIKESLKEDIEFLLGYFGADVIDPGSLTFKETRTYVQSYFWKKGDMDAVRRITETPTDVLRLFASLTETNVALTEPIKFPRLSRRQRRVVMEVLEGCSGLADDLVRYRGLWLEIGRFLHPGEYGKKFPKVVDAFDALRNGKIITYASKVEQATRKADIKAIINLLKRRPGVFARRICHVLEVAGEDYERPLRAFEKVSAKVPLKNLLMLESYVSSMESWDHRAIINKRGRIKVLANKRGRLAPVVRKNLSSVMSKIIDKKIMTEKPGWSGQKVWIDEELRNYAIPLQQRKASDGLMTLGRGTKIPLEKGKVLRLFVYWKDADVRTDLDLSVIRFDEDMSLVDYVSYARLKSNNMVHSGDIQSAPHGAAEFIDIDLADARKGSRYIASQVYKYAGSNFGDIECHAGWMIRSKVDKSYKSFDIKTVQNKLDLNGNCGYAIPIIVDLQENNVIFVDIYVNGNMLYNNVEGAHDNVSVIAKAMTRMIDTRPNLYQLAMHNVVGRKARLVHSKDNADITFGISGCDYNAQEVEKILSELI